MSYLLTSPVFASSDKDIQAEHHFSDSLYFSYGEDPASTSRHTQSPRVYRESALRMNGSPTFHDALISPSEPTDIYSVPHALSPIRTAHHLDFRSPSSFVDFYFSARDAKPITELSPGTPFQSLFVSSPNRYWEEVDLSVSPVCRHSPTVFHHRSSVPRGQQERTQKAESLLDYRKAPQTPNRLPALLSLISPSSLSSLSSAPSSPSAGSSGMLRTSSSSSLSSTRDLAVLCCPPASSSWTESLSASPSALKLSQEVHAQGPLRSRYGTRSRRRCGDTSQPRDCARGSTDPAGLLSRSPETPISSDVLGSHKNDSGKRTHQAARGKASNWKRRKLDKDQEPREQSVSNAQTTLDLAIAASSSNRTFPLSIPVHEDFPLFYRRFPVSSLVQASSFIKKFADATPNPPRGVLDLYTPRFVKGKGTSKVGLCPICYENVGRGGEGKKIWLSMKFSAFNYHMQYAHGISAMTGRPFSPPVAFRTTLRGSVGKHEKTSLMEGKCHKCKKWVAIEGIKDVPTKVKEIFWWKHAATCHQGSTIDGECDIYLEDELYRKALEAEKTDDCTDN